MAIRPYRPLCRTVALVVGCAACTACFAGHSVGASPTTLSPRAAAASGPTVRAPTSLAPTTTTSTTTASTTVESTTTTTLAPGPPYQISSLTLPLTDRSRPTVSHGTTISPSRALTTTVWFPSGPGRWPLVVFAHGFDVSPAPYAAMLEAWAAHGYVVAAPAFPLTDAAVAGANLDESDINNQPADVRFVTDQLTSPSDPVSLRVDRSRVAVAGHSDGAETALAASTDPVPAGEPPFRAVIVLSGQPVPGAPGRNPPALVVQGDADTTNPPDYGYSAWAQAASPKYLLVLKGAGHLPPFEAGSPWLSGVVAATETFLDAYVGGNGRASSVATSVSSYPDMTMRAG